jgi:AmiR/NasT family two-component response regulator
MEELDLVAAQALADVATIGILHHRAASEAQLVNEQLTHALNSRIVIEQAKGVLAERSGLDMEHAFAQLRKHARDHNLRLADVARGVVDGSVKAESLVSPSQDS